MKIIDGKKIQEELLTYLKKKRERFDKLVLGVISVGESPEKNKFLESKRKIAEKLEIDFRVYQFEENIKRKELRKKIAQLVKAKTIQGLMIQLPLPGHLNEQYFLDAIELKKDVECLSSKALGKFLTKKSIIVPPSVRTLQLIKEKYNLDFQNNLTVLVGYGKLIGRPVSIYLLQEGATLIVVNKKTKNKEQFFQMADILISGVGEPDLISQAKKDSVLIDFGCKFVEDKLKGDLNFDKLKNIASLITPTPGGTAPILSTVIFENFLTLVENYWKKN